MEPTVTLAIIELLGKGVAGLFQAAKDMGVPDEDAAKAVVKALDTSDATWRRILARTEE